MIVAFIFQLLKNIPTKFQIELIISLYFYVICLWHIFSIKPMFNMSKSIEQRNCIKPWCFWLVSSIIEAWIVIDFFQAVKQSLKIIIYALCVVCVNQSVEKDLSYGEISCAFCIAIMFRLIPQSLFVNCQQNITQISFHRHRAHQKWHYKTSYSISRKNHLNKAFWHHGYDTTEIVTKTEYTFEIWVLKVFPRLD